MAKRVAGVTEKLMEAAKQEFLKNYCRSNYSYQKTNHDYLPFSHKLSAV